MLRGEEDGEATDMSNLILRQLELIAIALYRRGLVIFDDEQGYIYMGDGDG